MIGNPTYYKNTFRTIAGLTNLVFDNDVVLLCDTSLGAVNLTLLEILADRFSTQYKLYIVDKSNNAGTNNITITAPIGYTVNNSSVAVVNVNNGVAVITISSNTTYNAQFNYISGGGGAIVVKNEGTIITTNATSFNYVGADVTATAIGGDVTVSIQSNFAIVTYAQLQVLISTNALVPSQQYLISDAIFTTTVLETVPIVVTAITTNEISLCGSGIFLNADYQAVGNYSGVVGFVAQIGIWISSLAPVIGDVCIWNNNHWVNTTGANGTDDPTIDIINWTLLAKSSTTGFITEIDNINYNVATNKLIYREDFRNNKVENNFNSIILYAYDEAFYFFQWGNDKTINNSIFSESYMNCCNWFGSTTNNSLINISFFKGLKSGNNFQLWGNSLDNSQISFDNNGKFTNNQFTNNISEIFIDTNCNFYNNNFEGGINLILQLNGTNQFQNNTFKLNNTNIIKIFQNVTGVFNDNTILFSPIEIINNTFEIIGNQISNAVIFNIDTNNGSINQNTFEYIRLQIALNDTGAFLNQNFLQASSWAITDNKGLIQGNSGVDSGLGVLLNLGQIANNHNLASKFTVNNNSILGRINNNILNNGNLDINTNNKDILQNNLNSGALRVTNVNDGDIGLNIVNSGSLITVFDNLVTGILQNNEISLASTLAISVQNSNIFQGNVMKNSSTITMDSNLGEFVGNVLNGSNFAIGGFNQGTINCNQYTASTITIGQNVLSNFSNNVWVNTTFLIGNDIAFDFNDTLVDEGLLNMPQLNYKVQGGVCQDNIGTIAITLDMTDPTVYDVVLKQLTIPFGYSQFMGEFFLSGGGGQIIELIVNLNGRYATKFKNSDSGTNVRFLVNNPLAVALPNELVCNQIAPFLYRIKCTITAFQDSIYIRRNSNLNAIEQVYEYL